MAFIRRPIDREPHTSADAILALDIGTEFVKAVIAKKTKSGKLDIIGVGKAHQEPSNMHAGAIADIEGVVGSCEKALTVAERTAGITAKATVIGIAGELVKGSTANVHYRRENGNKPITEQEMDVIMEKVQKQAEASAKKEIALETSNDNVEIRLINSAIVSLEIDGYRISNPIGFKGSDVTIQFYTAFAPLVHISAIEKVCAELNLDLLAVAVEPFAVCRACLGDDVTNNFSGIVMDIGGGTTDIAVVDDGGVEGTKMFSIGGRSFTRQIMESLGTDFATAEKYKLSLEYGKLEDDLRARIESALTRNLSVWLTGVIVALEDFSNTEVFPPRILLCGGGANLSLLQEELALKDWYKDLPFSRRPVIELIDIENIPDITNSTDAKLDCSYITALGLLRVGSDTMTASPEDRSIKGKLAKLLQN